MKISEQPSVRSIYCSSRAWPSALLSAAAALIVIAPAVMADASPSKTDGAKTDATAQTAAQSVLPPEADADNLETSLREVHETLRRMKGSVDDMLHEVTRVQQVYNNGVPVTNSPWALAPAFMAYNMTAQDALSHNVYLPPRAHWMENSVAQMNDLQTRLLAETANLGKLLQSPACNSATRSQGMVMGDIAKELGSDISNIQTLSKADHPSNAQLNAASRKMLETISGMDKVGDRLWKEAPRGLKKS